MHVYQMPHSVLRNSLNSQSAVIFQCHESLEMIKINTLLHAHHNASCPLLGESFYNCIVYILQIFNIQAVTEALSICITFM